MKKFNGQVFISLNLLFTFLIMLISGLILYVKPEGSVARWLDWNILLLNKSTWESVHTLFSFLFTLFALLHILIIHLPNLTNYLYNKNKRARFEIVLALLLSGIFLIGTAINIQPFNWVYKGGNYISDSWESLSKPGYPEVNAKTTLEDYSEIINIPEDTLKSKLQQSGMENISANSTFLEIGKENRMAPYEINELLSHIAPGEERRAETPEGNITLGEVAFLYNVDKKILIKKLKKHWSISDISKDNTLMEIAYMKKISATEAKDEIVDIIKQL